MRVPTGWSSQPGIESSRAEATAPVAPSSAHLHALVDLAEQLEEAALAGADVALHAHRQLPRQPIGQDQAALLCLAALPQVVRDQLAVPPVPDADVVLRSDMIIVFLFDNGCDKAASRQIGQTAGVQKRQCMRVTDSQRGAGVEGRTCKNEIICCSLRSACLMKTSRRLSTLPTLFARNSCSYLGPMPGTLRKSVLLC